MSASRPPRNRPPWLTLALLAALAALAALAVLAARPAPPVERSAIGFDGLALWLTAEGVSARRHTGAGPLSLDETGLRVLPLYDTDPTRGQSDPADGFDPDLNRDVRPIAASVLLEKLAQAPSVIVLPKWRDGVRRQGVRHEDLLINAGAGDPVTVIEANGHSRFARSEPADADRSEAPPEEGAEAGVKPQGETGAPRSDPPLRLPRLAPVEGDVRTVQTLAAPGRFGGQVRLAAPQYAEAGPDCAAIVGADERGLVFRCARGEAPFWVVSDPDLLNNHGLVHAENRTFAAALLEHLRAEAAGSDRFQSDAPGVAAIVIDYANHAWVVDGAPRGRDLSDLLRYVQPPFVWLWLAAALLFAAALWRGAVRERPLVTVFRQGHGAARRIAFQAQARLMRATGRDGALLRALAEARAARLCEILIGPGEAARTDRLIAQLRRRDPALGERVERMLGAVAELPDRVPAETAAQALRDLESVYQEACAFAGAETQP